MNRVSVKKQTHDISTRVETSTEVWNSLLGTGVNLALARGSLIKDQFTSEAWEIRALARLRAPKRSLRVRDFSELSARPLSTPPLVQPSRSVYKVSLPPRCLLPPRFSRLCFSISATLKLLRRTNLLDFSLSLNSFFFFFSQSHYSIAETATLPCNCISYLLQPFKIPFFPLKWGIGFFFFLISYQKPCWQSILAFNKKMIEFNDILKLLINLNSVFWSIRFFFMSN